MKEQKGITLIALVVTVIILVILAGVGIGTMAGKKGNITKSKKEIILSELSQIQQIILEGYIKYQQTHNIDSIVGEKITYNEAKSILEDVGITARAKDYNLSSSNIELFYYKLEPAHLEQMGIQNSQYSYIVNYSTGEVFNYTQKRTKDGEILYEYAR